MTDYSTFSEEELASFSQSGNMSAANELLLRLKPLVRSLARQRFLSGGEPDDLIQEGTIALFEAAQSFDANKKTSFKTHAANCIKNRLIDAVRKSTTVLQKPLNDSKPIDDYACSASNAPDPADFLLTSEELRAINDVMNSKFTTSEKKLFLLYLQGYSYAELSVILGLPAKKVDNLLQKCKKIIRKSAAKCRNC